MKSLGARVKQLPDRYLQWLARREFAEQSFHHLNERPVELAFVFRSIAQLCPRTVLDVGTGKSALPSLMRRCGCLVTAIDNVRDYWTSGMTNRHYHVIDDDITKTRIREEFDLVTCVSVLEHIQDASTAVRNMFGLTCPGGHLILTFPYGEHRYISDVYKMAGSTYGQDVSYVCQSFSAAEVNTRLTANRGEIIEQEYWRFWEGDFWTSGGRVVPPLRTTAKERHQLTCVLVRKKGTGERITEGTRTGGN